MDYPLINGTRYSFASIELTLNGQRYVGFKELNYNQDLDPGEVRGAHSQMLGRTRGDLKADGSISMFEEEWNSLLAALGAGYMEVPFDVSAAYAETNSPTITDVLHGCRIKKVDKSRSQGTEGLVVKLDLSIVWITLNGVEPLKGMLATTAPSSSANAGTTSTSSSGVSA